MSDSWAACSCHILGAVSHCIALDSDHLKMFFLVKHLPTQESRQGKTLESEPFLVNKRLLFVFFLLFFSMMSLLMSNTMKRFRETRKGKLFCGFGCRASRRATSSLSLKHRG